MSVNRISNGRTRRVFRVRQSNNRWSSAVSGRGRALATAFTGMNNGRMNSANSAASPTPTAPNKPS